MSPTQIPNRYRVIVEMTSMMNNEEWVIYSDRFLTIEDYQEELNKVAKRKDFWTTDHFIHEGPSFVLCRPIFEEEVHEGLNPSYSGPIDHEKVFRYDSLTSTLDALYKLIQSVQWRVRWRTYQKPSHLLAELLAIEYYDCMSASFPSAEIAAIRIFLRNLNLNEEDLNYPVYPSAREEGSCTKEDHKGWWTLRDWIEETKEFEEVEEKVIPLLPTNSIKLLVEKTSND